MEEIYKQYYRQLVHFGLKMIKNNQVVEDIVTDCILAFFDHSYAKNLANRILYACVRNKCVDHMRTKKVHDQVNHDLFNEEYIAAQKVEAVVLRLLSEAIKKLPNDQRQVITMYYLEEKTCVQIARLLDKPPATIRSLKRHGMDKLLNLKHLK